MTETAQTEVKKEKLKKGEGPVVLNFLDGENKEAPRISDKTVSLQIKDKSNGVLSVAISSLPAAVVNQLALDGLKRRIDSTVRASVDAEGKDKDGNLAVLKTAQEVIARIMAGQIYARTGTAAKEGGTGVRGRPFDTKLWVESMKEAQRIKTDAKKVRADGTPFTYATDDQLERLRVKLEAATPADRKKMTDGFLKDKTVAFARQKIILARAADAAKAELQGENKEVSVELD